MNYLINEGINKNMRRKDKIQLIIIWGLALLLWLGGYIALSLYTSTPAGAAPLESRCPAGSYEIGEKDGQAICKLEPTGCPYGDSIPLGPECDKHAESHKEGSPVWDRWEPDAEPTAPTSQPAPKAAPQAPKPANNESFGGAGASETNKINSDPVTNAAPSEPEEPRINKEQGSPVADTNKTEPSQATTAGVAGGILSVLGIVGAVIKRRFLG